MTQICPVYALDGDSLTAPQNTLTAYWAGLGGGADGLAFGVRLTKDGQAVCVSHDSLAPTTGTDKDVDQVTAAEIEKLDAGATFRSTVLDDNNQPTGEQGTDLPWQGDLPKKRRIVHPTLSETLLTFARRTNIVLMLPHDDTWSVDKLKPLVSAVVSDLNAMGVQNRATIAARHDALAMVREQSSQTPLAMYAGPGSGADNVKTAQASGAAYLVMSIEDACPDGTTGPILDADLEKAAMQNAVGLLLRSSTMPFAPRPDYGPALLGKSCVTAVLGRGVPETADVLTPGALVFDDDFKGTKLDTSKWTAGYSHQNQDTLIKQDDGFHIIIQDGGSYSGGACMPLLHIPGRFDARTRFSVGNPQQGTTFEMAAIGIDPGYLHMDNSDLTSRSVNLTFDVHGAPPYASSERDENDGFRIGWNNGFNLTKVDSDWAAASVNMYNKYGRDVGNGDADNPDGWLRMVRNGHVFATYYKDKYNSAWVCSGAVLVQNLGPDVCIRLAAKHWAKGGKSPPGNHVTFHQFELYQF